MGNGMPDGISRGSCMEFKCLNRDKKCNECLNKDMYKAPRGSK